MPEESEGAGLASPAGNDDLSEPDLRQETIARFGELALQSESLDEILQEACRLVGAALGTGLAKVLELQADGHTLLVRAGVGWKDGVVGHTRIQAEEDSSEGHALRIKQPVICQDVRHETRFSLPSFLRDHGVQALVNVVILGGKDRRPYGVLEVDSRVPHRFTARNVSFLRGYANLLALAVDRLWVVHETKRAEAFVSASSHVMFSVNADWSEMNQLKGGDFLASRTTANRDWMIDYIPQDERLRVEAEFKAAIAAKRLYSIEHKVNRANGSVGWALSRAVPLLDTKGDIVEWFGAASDVTARRHAEQALRQSDRWLHQAQEAGRIGAFTVDVRAGMAYPTPEFCRLYGIPVCESIEVQDIEALTLPEDAASVSNDASRRSGQATSDVVYRIRRHDTGELRWISRRAEFEHDDGGRPIRFSGIVQEITADRNQAAALARLNQDLEQRVEERTREHDRIWRLSRDMLGVADVDGVWVSVNPAWTKILGWPEAEIVGRTS